MKYHAVKTAAMAKPIRATRLHQDRLLLQFRERLVVVDQRLEIVLEVSRPSEHEAGGDWVSRNLDYVAFSLENEVRLSRTSGAVLMRLPHSGHWSNGVAGGACAMNEPATSLFARVPLGEREEEEEMVLIDVHSGEVLDRASVGSSAYTEPVPHPDGETIGWAMGVGGTKASTIWSAHDRSHLVLRRLATNNMLADIHPSGHEYLTVQLRGAIQRRRFLTETALEELPPDHKADWSTRAVYLDNERVVARRDAYGSDDAYVLLGVPLAVLGDIAYPNQRVPDYLVTAIGSAWFTIGDGQLVRWELAEPARD